MDKLNDQKVINSLAKIRARVITVKFGLTIEIQSCAKFLSHLISLYIAKKPGNRFIQTCKHTGLQYARQIRVCTIITSVKVNIWYDHFYASEDCLHKSSDFFSF